MEPLRTCKRNHGGNPFLQNSLVERLPVELWINIFNYLGNTFSKIRLSLACRYLRAVFLNEKAYVSEEEAISFLIKKRMFEEKGLVFFSTDLKFSSSIQKAVCKNGVFSSCSAPPLYTYYKKEEEGATAVCRLNERGKEVKRFSRGIDFARKLSGSSRFDVYEEAFSSQAIIIDDKTKKELRVPIDCILSLSKKRKRLARNQPIYFFKAEEKPFYLTGKGYPSFCPPTRSHQAVGAYSLNSRIFRFIYAHGLVSTCVVNESDARAPSAKKSFHWEKTQAINVIWHNAQAQVLQAQLKENLLGLVCQKKEQRTFILLDATSLEIKWIHLISTKQEARIIDRKRTFFYKKTSLAKERWSTCVCFKNKTGEVVWRKRVHSPARFFQANSKWAFWSFNKFFLVLDVKTRKMQWKGETACAGKISAQTLIGDFVFISYDGWLKVYSLLEKKINSFELKIFFDNSEGQYECQHIYQQEDKICLTIRKNNLSFTTIALFMEEHLKESDCMET